MKLGTWGLNRMWTIHLLGGLAAHGRQRTITRFRTQKAASLLAYIAFHPASHSRETLIEILWPDTQIEAGRHNLSNALSFLRHMLEPPGVPPGTVILADRFSVLLNTQAVTTDVFAFETAVSEAGKPGLSQAERIPLWEQAVTVYRGVLLPGFYEEWISPQMLRLEIVFMQTLGQLVTALLEAGEPNSALTYAQRAVTTDPLSEEAMLNLVQSLSAVGQPAQARRAYRAFAQRLEEELNTEPSEELKRWVSQLGQSGSPVIASTVARSISLPQEASHRSDFQDTRADLSSHRYAPRGHLVGGEFLLRTTTRFFGREAELARLAKMLSSPVVRLVTLMGTAGMGKTRLALEVAAYLVEVSFEGPTWAAFVPLADISEVDHLNNAILQALGILPASELERGEQLVQTLSAYPEMLLVLDNFEHLAEAGALWVHELLAKAPTVRLLITSRQKLGIEGEREFHLASLPTSQGIQILEELMTVPSIALFVDRAEAVLADFQLTQRNAVAVGQLCDYLEGIPLAIELSAARVSVLTPARILGEVQANRLDFLTTRRRDASSRQTSLRATLNWSYQLLPEKEQKLLAALSVFRGGWTLEAAQEISSLNPSEILDSLMTLRDNSLIGTSDTEGGLRFTMLETIREYLDETLEASGEKQSLCRAHAAYFVGLAEESYLSLVRPEGLVTIRLLGAEQPNFRTARLWMEDHREDSLNNRLGITLMQVWSRLNWAKVERWLSDVHETPTCASGETSPYVMAEPIANLVAPMGGITQSIDDLDRLISSQRQLAEKFGQADEYLHQAWVLINIGYLLRDRSLSESRNSLTEALLLMRQYGTALGVASALTQLSNIICLQGDYESAMNRNAEAFLLLENHRDTLAYGHALLIETNTSLMAGDLPRARQYCEENFELRQRIEDRPGVGVALMMLGLVDIHEGELLIGASRLEEASAVFSRTAWDTSLFADYTRCFLGRARLGLGQLDDASNHARMALRNLANRKSRYGMVICLDLLAKIACVQGQPVRAVRVLGASETVRSLLGFVSSVRERAQLDRFRVSLMELIGNERFLNELEAGHALTEDDAIEMALEEAPVNNRVIKTSVS